MCIQNNPNEARNMLLQNPQLAYALLQAQIVMKIVDPQVALVSTNRSTIWCIHLYLRFCVQVMTWVFQSVFFSLT